MCYLVLLMHNYFVSLVTAQPGSTRAPVSFQPRVNILTAPGSWVKHWMAAGAAWLYAQILALMSYMHVLCNEAAFAPHCLLLHVEVRNPSFHLSLVILRSCQLRLAELYIDMHQATPCMGYL